MTLGVILCVLFFCASRDRDGLGSFHVERWSDAAERDRSVGVHVGEEVDGQLRWSVLADGGGDHCSWAGLEVAGGEVAGGDRCAVRDEELGVVRAQGRDGHHDHLLRSAAAAASSSLSPSAHRVSPTEFAGKPALRFCGRSVKLV
jgi:hypothetical protein